MTEDPFATAVASPFDPEVLLIVAVELVCDDHVTVVVMSCVVLSEYVSVALNCCVCPCAMVGFVGVTVMPVSVP